MAFDEFDKRRIASAREMLWKVFEFNYGDPSMRKEVDRLGTIIGKIDQLLNMKGGEANEGKRNQA